MSANGILAQPLCSPQPIPTFTDILEAPEDQWRDLAILADADLAYCERQRARRKIQQEEAKPTRRKRRSRRNPRPNRSNRHFRAANVLSQVAPAMSETLDRVNSNDDTEDTHTVLVNACGHFAILEVA